MDDQSLKRIRDVSCGENVRIMDFVNLYGCTIGDESFIGPFVEIQEGARIGSRCKIESHTFVCSGTVIEDEVFVGHNVTFTNDRNPEATTVAGKPKTSADWKLEPVTVEQRAAIGSGAVILPGVRVGAGALVGAGAVVTRDISPSAVVVGNPARVMSPSEARRMQERGAVSLLDLRAEHAEAGKEIDEAIHRVIQSGTFIGGSEVEAFEREFAGLVEGRAVAGVSSGTDALRLALMALSIGPGDEVVVPANTFTATAMAVEAVGATPVVSDVDEDLYVITPELVEPLINRNTKAIIPVHLYGHPVSMEGMRSLADEHDLLILEDSAQAHGAYVNGRPVGVWGDAAAFSFYPSKNLGGYGDGGAVVGSSELIARVQVLRDLGRDGHNEHVEFGLNSRLDALQAAVLRAKLPRLSAWVQRRRALARRYSDLLSDLSIAVPCEAPWAAHAFYLFVVRVSGRDRIRDGLREAGIETGIHYPVPIHRQKAHTGRVKAPSKVPVAERLAGEILSLPLYPQMTEELQDLVVGELVRILQHEPVYGSKRSREFQQSLPGAAKSAPLR